MTAARSPLTRASEVPYEVLCQFLYQEARLLDQRNFDEWNDLFAEGGKYWIPLARIRKIPLIICPRLRGLHDENVRINRLNHDRAWSQKPRSRTSHTVSAIVVESVCEASNRLVVGSAFTVAEWRSFGHRTFAGLYTHTLQISEGRLQIVEKRVDLIDSAEAFEPIEVFI